MMVFGDFYSLMTESVLDSDENNSVQYEIALLLLQDSQWAA